jgi:FkbM family methyltransferase
MPEMSALTTKVMRRSFRLLSGFPFPLPVLKAIERLSALLQGKGWGSSTIREEIDCCMSLLKNKPDIVIDIGANKGLYAEQLLERYPDASFFLFEPSPFNHHILQEKFYGCKNINIFKDAVSSTTGSAMLFSNEEGSGLASLTKRQLDHLGISMNLEYCINTIRLDDFLDGPLRAKIIDYIKIDIEGHELDALIGMGERIRDAKIIQFEFGGCNIDTRTFFRDFWYFFEANNFRVYRITPTGCSLIPVYRESDEFFSTTNYVAVNNALVP